VLRRRCAFRFPDGQPCRAAPLRDGEFCIMHSPEHAKEVQEARRLGGLIQWEAVQGSRSTFNLLETGLVPKLTDRPP
jgi:hypothetical protein